MIGENQLTFTTSPYTTLEVEGSVAWQSFRSSATGILSRLDIAISAYKGATTEEQFCGEIAVLRGDGPTGAQMGDLAIRMGANDIANPRLIGFPLTGITLTAGETYTWTVTHNGCAPVALGYGTGNLYPAGSSSLGTNIDFGFRTYLSIESEAISIRAALLADAPVAIGTQTLNPDAMLDVNGKIYQRGAQLHADYVFQPGYDLESIDERGLSMWTNHHLPAVPATTWDENGNEVLELGQHQRGILEELEKAHIYILSLHKRLEALESTIGQD